MKKTILILSMMLPLLAMAEVRLATVNVNMTTRTVATEVQYDTDARTALLGNGHNACVPQFTSGRIVIPSSILISGVTYQVTGVNELAFRLCDALTQVDFSEGIATIGDFAFVGCNNLHVVSLPSTLTTVGGGAFVGLDNLVTIKSKATQPPAWTWNDVFEYDGEVSTNRSRGLALERKLYVPVGATDNYYAKSFNNVIGWSDAFPRIYELPSDTVVKDIGTLAELKQLRDYVNQGALGDPGVFNGATNFRLTADITFPSGERWEPIGTIDHPFEGTFDGGGHCIHGLDVDLSFSTLTYGGFFGCASNASIYNIAFSYPLVVGTADSGVLLGYCPTTVSITDVMVVGEVTDGSDYTVMSINGYSGGLVGQAKQAQIERCYFIGSVSAKDYVGGLVGNMHYGAIVNSGAGGTVCLNASYGKQGGLVGGSQKTSDETQSTLRIERCYSWCSLTSSVYSAYGYIYKGGIIGTTSHYVQSADCFYYTADDDDLQPCGSYSYHSEIDCYALSDLTSMEDDKLEWLLGDTDWYYFLDGYEFYPIPKTMSEWYLENFVYTKIYEGYILFSGFYGIPTHRGTQLKIVKYAGSGSQVRIPTLSMGVPVTEMVDHLLDGNEDVTQILFTANTGQTTGITTGDYFAANCPNLLTVKIAGIDALGEMNFYNCPNFEYYEAGVNPGQYSVTEKALYKGGTLVHCPPAYVDDGGARRFVLPEGKTAIGAGAFAFSRLESITLGDDLTTIGAGAFDGAEALHYVDATEATSLDDCIVRRHDPENAFYGMNPLTLIFLPDGVEDDDVEANVVIGDFAGNVILNDAWDFYSPVDIVAINGVQFTRTLTSEVKFVGEEGNISGDDAKQLEETAIGYTVYQPYDVDLSEYDNVTVYVPREVDTVDGVTTITFVEQEDKKLDCYTPYYVVVNEDAIRLNADGPTMIFTSFIEFPTEVDGYEFMGTVTTLDNAEAAARGAYILQSDNAWHRVPAGVDAAYVPAYRAFFGVAAGNNAPARRLAMRLAGDDTPTDVTVIRAVDRDGDDRYFDLNGRLLPGKPDNGIYIHNGEKHVVRR